MNTYPEASAPQHAGATYAAPTTAVAASAVSWAAILAGASAAAALSLILLALGSGLGFSSLSPWANTGALNTAVGVATVLWLILMAAIASGLGGYLAGRLRTRWIDVHSDEVYFRDTAHGFLAWAIATLLTAGLLSSAATSLIGGAAKLGGAAVGAAAATSAAAVVGERTQDNSSNGYYVDMLLRTDAPSTDVKDASTRLEVSRVFVEALSEGELWPADRVYLGRVVARRTGATQAEAELRVTQTIEEAKAAVAKAEADAREAADAARKLAAKLSLWLFVSLLVGAFCGSYAATIGGRQRDRV